MTNEQGTCPHCGTWGQLDYEGIVFEEIDVAYFKWVCGNCEGQGNEYYVLEFDGHSIINEHNEEEMI